MCRSGIAVIILSTWCVIGSPSVPQVLAQEQRPAQMRAAQAMRSLERAAGSEAQITQSHLTGLAKFVTAGPHHSIPLSVSRGEPAEARGLAFLAEHGASFGILDSSQVRVVARTDPDETGMEHIRLQKIHEGLPVTGGQLLLHLRGSGVTAVSAKTLPDLDNLDIHPAIRPDAALATARRLMEGRLGSDEAQYSLPRLEIFNRGLLDGTPQLTHLAWFVEARRPEGREFIWIDAHRGDLLLHFDQVTPQLNRNVFSGLGWYSLPGTLMRQETDAATSDADVEAAYQFAGDAYRYFMSLFGRDSYDGNGGPAIMTVHYGVGYKNAYWDGDQLVFGDYFAQADDVVAHEWTHALTEHTAGLFYYMQSGALSEAFSDIFGETVDLCNLAGDDSPAVRWLQGEDLPNGAVRDLMNPHAFKQPDKMSDAEYFGCFDPPVNDNGGVHRNSGVLNHAYALMVDGGTFNGFAIHGIGLEKAARVMYRTLTEYLTASADFQDAYLAIKQASIDLIEAGQITAMDADQVAMALDAVELASPWPCTQSPPVIPLLCPASSVPLTLLYDDLEDIHSTLWSPHTLSGLNNWTGGMGNQGIYYSELPISGAYHFWGGYKSYVIESDSALEMTRDVLIPPQHPDAVQSSFWIPKEWKRQGLRWRSSRIQRRRRCNLEGRRFIHCGGNNI